MKYALFDEKWLPIGFYDDTIHTNLPNGAIPITYEQWSEFINNQGKRKWNPDINSVEIYEYVPSLEELKDIKLHEIKKSFEEEFMSGKITSSLGFDIDARRSALHNDLENVNGLIELGIEPINFRDADNQMHELTLTDLQVIKQELIQAVLQRYQRKWGIEQQIENATTLEELEAIKW